MADFTTAGNNLAERVGQLFITLATGSIVFSVSLLPTGTVVADEPWLLRAWILFLATVVLGVIFLVSMLGFYYFPKLRIFGRKGLATLPLILFVIEAFVFLLGLSALSLFAVGLEAVN